MEPASLLSLETWQLMLILLVAMITSVFIGLYARKKINKALHSDSMILSTLFALLGLLLAFTFSLSVNRFDMKRAAIIEEANDIGTAVLRADLYAEPDRQLLRADFKKYVDARAALFTVGTNIENEAALQKLSASLQQQLWNRVSKLSKDPANYIASMQMVPALNSMIDITTTRQYGNLTHLPDLIVYLLFLLSCVCAFYIGYLFAVKEKFDWLQAAGFCLLTSLVIYVIIDMDHPRRGFITLNQISQSVVGLKQMFTQ